LWAIDFSYRLRSGGGGKNGEEVKAKIKLWTGEKYKKIESSLAEA